MTILLQVKFNITFEMDVNLNSYAFMFPTFLAVGTLGQNPEFNIHEIGNHNKFSFHTLFTKAKSCASRSYSILKLVSTKQA